MNTLSEPIAQAPANIDSDLRLRQFVLKDANDLLRLHEDSEMTRWLLDDVELDTLAVTSDFILGLRKLYRESPGLGIWAFERLEKTYSREQLIEQGALNHMSEDAMNSLLQPKWVLKGWFNLTPVPEFPQNVELGSRLDRSAWGQRIACSVGEQLVCYAFDVLEITDLYLHCHPLNRPALYCASYLGFDDPEPVDFLGSKALRLSATANSAEQVNSMNDSARRRSAIAQVHLWTSGRVAQSA